MKSKFAKLTDSVFTAVAVWLFSAIIFRYFIKELYLVVIAATIFTLGFVFLLRQKSGKSDEEKYFAAKIADFFLLKDEAFTQDYFFNAFKKRYADATQNTTSPFNQGYIRINNTLIYVCMGEPLSLKRVVLLYTLSLKEKAATAIILCPMCEKNVSLAKGRLTDLKLEIFTGEKVYKLLKSLSSVPQFNKKPYKERMSEFFSAALRPERSKSYLFTSITLLIGAYFSQFWLYFLISGSVCLSLALLSRINVLGRKA